MNIEEKSFTEAMTRAGDRLFHMQVAENDRGTQAAVTCRGTSLQSS